MSIANVLTFVVGFSCIAGIAFGYAIGRNVPRRVLWVVWGVLAVLSIAIFAVFAFVPASIITIEGAVLIGSTIPPFAGSAFISSLIGMVARRMSGEE